MDKQKMDIVKTISTISSSISNCLEGPNIGGFAEKKTKQYDTNKPTIILLVTNGFMNIITFSTLCYVEGCCLLNFCWKVNILPNLRS